MTIKKLNGLNIKYEIRYGCWRTSASNFRLSIERLLETFIKIPFLLDSAVKFDQTGNRSATSGSPAELPRRIHASHNKFPIARALK